MSSIVVSWYAVFIIGILSHRFSEKFICPEGELISGSCHNNSVQIFLSALPFFFVAASAFTVVIVGRLVAPSHKKNVVWVVFVVGAITACVMGYKINEASLLGSALFGGFLGLVAFKNRASSRA